MKKNKLFLILIILLLIFPKNISALVLDKNEVKILPKTEKKLKLSANLKENKVKEISFDLIYNSLDLPGKFIALDDYEDKKSNTKHTIAFDEIKSGVVELGIIKIKALSDNTNSSIISLSNAKALTVNGDIIELENQTIKIIISEEEDSNLLDRIESDIVNIPLIKDKFTYTVKIKDTIKELDLKPIPASEFYEVETSSQLIKENEDNKIEIKVIDNENEITETYNINIEVENSREEKIEKDFSYRKKYILLSITYSVILLFGLILTRHK